jgi:hypothetical protein
MRSFPAGASGYARRETVASGAACRFRLNTESPGFAVWSVPMKAMLKAAALAGAVMFAVAGGAAAQDDDQDCDNIMDELKKLAERLMNTSEPKGVGPVCSATGQLLGIIKASREVAAECYEEGKKRDQILLTFDKASKEMETNIDSVCK